MRLKTVRFGLNIGVHDLGTKLNQARRFLQGGNQVKMLLVLRGRENSRPEHAQEFLRGVVDNLTDDGVVSGPLNQSGRQMSLTLNPRKR